MRFLPPLLLSLLLLAGCAQPGWVKRRGTITVTNSLRVRTTAYTGRYNAIGSRLRHGPVISAASDWSQFPLGTRFRVLDNPRQIYEIDDYGPALVGTRTIDLCAASTGEMHQWGVRWIDIDVLEWGSPRRSLEVLTPREGSRYVRRMAVALRRQSGGVPQKFHRIEQ